MISPEILRRYPFVGTLSDAQLKVWTMIGEEDANAQGSVVCEECKPIKVEKDYRVVQFDTAALKKLTDKDPQLYCKLMREITKSAMERLAYARVQLATAWAK